MDRMEEKALAEVEKRNPEFSEELKLDISHKIAIGALRYFMLKFARNSVIVFDFADALSFEGETGPYLQYTFVRINSIFRKLEEVEGYSGESLETLIQKSDFSLEKLSEVRLRISGNWFFMPLNWTRKCSIPCIPWNSCT